METHTQLSKVLGATHPDTLVCEANLVVIAYTSGRTDEALQLQQRILTSMAIVLGESHPNVTALRQWRLQNRDLEPQPT